MFFFIMNKITFWYALQEPGGPEGGLGPDYFANVFIFLGSIIRYRLCKRILSDQVQATLQLKISLADLV